MQRSRKTNYEETVWLISKYAVLPEFGPPNRQYFISKFFHANHVNTRLITSRSCAYARLPAFMGLYKSYTDADGLPYTILNGPTIGLGFSTKRLYSWVLFEINLLFYALVRYRKRPKVLYISSLSILTFLTGALLKKIFRCKLVVEVRDIWPETLVAFGGYKRTSLVIRLLKKIEKIGYQNADLIVGSMPKLNEHVRTIMTKDFQFLNVPMGYDKGFYKLDFEDLENDISVIGKLSEIRHLKLEYRFSIAYAGTIGKANFVEELLETADILGSDYGIFIIGDGPLKGELQKQYRASNIHFLGSCSKKYLPKILNEFDLLVNMWGKKQIYDYGVSPNKWIDYMLSKRPILVSFDGFRSIINEASCGWFIPANDPLLLANKIISILDNHSKEELVQLGLNGSNFVQEKLNYSVLVKELYQAVSKL